MSNFNDSIEDDVNDDTCSVDSLEVNKPIPVKEIRQSISKISKKPFYLTRRGHGENVTQISNGQLSVPETSNVGEKNFLPKIGIGNKEKDKKTSLLNIEIDTEALNKQGLQLNSDGSFTKSPRFEELPFVTREYRNLLFQKKKTYELKKNETVKTSITNKKELNTCKKNSVVEVPNVINSGRKKKGSNEEVLKIERSHSSFAEKNLKNHKHFEQSDNLTDSMKEILLKKHSNTQLENRAFKNSKHPKGVKNGMCLLERRRSFSSAKKSVGGSTERPTGLPVRRSVENAKCKTVLKNQNQKTQNSTNTHSEYVVDKKVLVKDSSSKNMKYQSDISIKLSQPRLSYLEIHQRKNGFEPLYLRFDAKKTLMDTNRSNFGDSTPDLLSEVSSRVLTCKDATDNDDEEEFYFKLMENDRSRKLGVQKSATSNRHRDTKKFVGSSGPNSCQDHKELQYYDPKNRPCKRVPKSISIDIAVEKETKKEVKKKSSHYCTTINSPPSLPKVALANKAKIYGYMANARNIFKMKTQSDLAKVNVIKKKVVENVKSEKILPKSIFKDSAVGCPVEEIKKKEKSSLRTSRSLCKSENYEGVNKRNTISPRRDLRDRNILTTTTTTFRLIR